MSDVSIKFDGVRFDAWQKVSVRESVDELCAAVQLESAAMPGAGGNLGLTANTVVSVLADDALVTMTRIDLLRRRVTATQHSIAVDARSIGRELVDCQYSATLSGLTLGEIAKRICSIFKVPLEVRAKTQIVPEFAMQCELPANALLNAVRAANLLLYPLSSGGLVLTAPTNDAAVASLVYGRDIVSYDVVDEHRLRFSEYVVKSFDYISARALRGAAKDEGLTFFRPMHIVADRHGHDLMGCDSRAVLERNRRQARANRIDLVVRGWGHATDLWRVNTQVRVVIPPEDIDEVFFVGERTLSLDAQGGRETRLQVMPRNAFLGEPKAHKKRAAGLTGDASRASGGRR
ncbi:phage baseplate assembly protein [Limnohabitans sp.]|uniref:phage baseplate assembly protein n=1 Tax=Limnohabitans sp. TaxID=1907725 RepID=UPI00286EDDA2|nr:phage tail protein [Limnohabitans sp.]